MSKMTKGISLCLSIILIFSTAFCSLTLISGAASASKGTVNGSNVHVRSAPSTSSTSLDKVSYIAVDILDTVSGSANGDTYKWYKVTYKNSAGSVVNGYIREDLVDVFYEQPDLSFEQQIAAFPESYRASLRTLHAQFPNWVFIADKLSMSFETAVTEEGKNNRKQVNFSSDGVSWRSMNSGYYDWSNNTWSVTNGGWVGASYEVIAYYMDPRNFLNASEIYMFLQQSYDKSIQTEAGLKTLVSGTFLANGYSGNKDAYIKDIMDAAAQSGVNPYVIASIIIQEQGASGSSRIISGTTEFGSVYNFFNYNAYGINSDAVVSNALNYAKNNGWTTRSASIIGGAVKYGSGYLNAGQDTYFYKNFNLLGKTTLYGHQYAQSVYDARSSAYKGREIFSANKQDKLVFRIPVYTSLPSSVAPKPAENSKRNNYYFDSISVTGLTPSFNRYTYDYNLAVSGNVNVKAELPQGASIVSASSFALKKGDNKVVLKVKSETGYTNNYTINVKASSAATLYVNADNFEEPKVIIRGDTNGDGKISIVDLANVQKHLLGIITLKGDSFSGADTNADGKISIVDLANVQKHLLGLIKL